MKPFCHSFSFFYYPVTRSRNTLKISLLKKQILAISKWMCHYSVYTSDQWWMCHCLSSTVVPQLTVTLRLLSSAMHVTPGLLPERRCWWDGSLTGPAAAPDTLLIYNAQLWKRNQCCLYAKPAGAKTWWEMKNVTLSFFHADTHLMLWLYLNDTHRAAPICCCAVRKGSGCRDITSQHDEGAWWNEIYSNNDM